MKVLAIEPACELDEIAKELGVSRERVRQIQERALKKLRVICAERHIELRDLTTERPANDNDALLIRRSGEQMPHSLPPRIHGYTPIALPPFPLPKE